MKAHIKQGCIKYFESIGGIEKVNSEYRFRLKRAVIKAFISLDDEIGLSKFIVIALPPPLKKFMK